jgi:hypothetical protein
MLSRTKLLAACSLACLVLVFVLRSQHRELESVKEELARLAPSAAQSKSRTLKEMDALLAEHHRRVGAVIEQAFQLEARDSSWSGLAEAQIDAAMSALSSAKMVSHECRATLCRVVASHEDEKSQREMPTQLSRLPPFDNAVFYAHDVTSVPLTTTMYVARAGHELPRPPRSE